MKRLAWFALATATLAACGDDEGGTDIDAQVVDAAIDAQDIDTPPPTFSGSISLLEVAVLNPGTGGTFFGQGPQVSIALVSSEDVPGPIMEEMSSALGCKAWEYTPAQAAAAAIGADEGMIELTLAGTTPPSTPPCTFTAGVGYTCPHTNGTAGTGGIIAAGPNAGTATLTDADNSFGNGSSLGRYLRISGATNAANNGAFPIVARPTATTLVYANPAFVAETLPATATHVNIFGLGPIPGAADPGFINDDNTVSVTLTAGGGNHFDTFTSTTSSATFGDDFDLATAELEKLNAIPEDGTAFTITCDAADCPAGSAAGTVLNIVTTDAPTAGLSPFAMPLPTTKQVKIRCGVLGSGAITVPAAYSALIQSSGATRIQASFIRGALLIGGPENVSVVAGHAVVGFTN
ncbi:MAG: hypothetical protein F9K40_14645 [Kofleriaceae bacterium]|nr:MAG: hypothetical protein F9K40_14645 [Kofleriaceae bacterium]MBZ0237615.1 hypothetical protein [Kofleriaceae bacterium]